MTVQIQFVGIGASGDCDNNGLLDTRDIGANAAQDRDMNSLLDSCQIHTNPLLDRNNNGVLDSWDVAVDPTLDCNRNFLIDIYEIVDAPSMDCNFNNIIDTCDIAAGSSDDDLDNHPDQCQYDKGDLDLSGNIDLGDVGICFVHGRNQSCLRRHGRQRRDRLRRRWICGAELWASDVAVMTPHRCSLVAAQNRFEI